MDTLKIERTQSTPEVIFDADEFSLSIRGACRPENAQLFFTPLLSWLEEFNNQYNRTASTLLNVEISLSYFNSASFLYIAELFKNIKKISNAGIKVIVSWYYSEEDELINEAGHEISDISELPFNFIEE